MRPKHEIVFSLIIDAIVAGVGAFVIGESLAEKFYWQALIFFVLITLYIFKFRHLK
jgi:hypothetical protein